MERAYLRWLVLWTRRAGFGKVWNGCAQLLMIVRTASTYRVSRLTGWFTVTQQKSPF